MNIKEFAQKLQAILTKLLKTEITITERLKLNGVRLTGLMIRNPKSNVSPTIFLDPYYEEYQETGDLAGAVTGIMREYQDYSPTESFDIEWFKDAGQVKNLVCYRLIHYDSNLELLASIPHTRYLDLARIYYIPCRLSGSSSGSITVTNAHLEMWGITAAELDRLAEANTPALLEPSITRIEDCLSEAGICSPPEEEPKGIPHLHVLTNRLRTNGAAAMYYPDLLQAFSAKNGKDTAVLPSSIHEVLLLPLDGKEDVNALRETVRSVNASHVIPKERLSDNVYIYRKDTGQLRVA